MILRDPCSAIRLLLDCSQPAAGLACVCCDCAPLLQTGFVTPTAVATFACTPSTGYVGCRECWVHGNATQLNASRPPCANVAGPGQHAATFHPTKLDTDNWADSMIALGAKAAVLTAKHDSGYLLWATKVRLPNGAPYEYAVGSFTSVVHDNVLQMFRDSMARAGLGHGIYYSIGNNVYLNVNNGVVMTDHKDKHTGETLNPLPGMATVTQSEFEAIAFAHLHELWSEYGNLTEIWFDGGLMAKDMHAEVRALLPQLQPDVAVYGGGTISNSSCSVRNPS